MTASGAAVFVALAHDLSHRHHTFALVGSFWVDHGHCYGSSRLSFLNVTSSVNILLPFCLCR